MSISHILKTIDVFDGYNAVVEFNIWQGGGFFISSIRCTNWQGERHFSLLELTDEQKQRLLNALVAEVNRFFGFFQLLFNSIDVKSAWLTDMYHESGKHLQAAPPEANPPFRKP